MPSKKPAVIIKPDDPWVPVMCICSYKPWPHKHTKEDGEGPFDRHKVWKEWGTKEPIRGYTGKERYYLGEEKH